MNKRENLQITEKRILFCSSKTNRKENVASQKIYTLINFFSIIDVIGEKKLK